VLFGAVMRLGLGCVVKVRLCDSAVGFLVGCIEHLSNSGYVIVFCTSLCSDTDDCSVSCPCFQQVL
jgi:hypothetical protein